MVKSIGSALKTNLNIKFICDQRIWDNANKVAKSLIDYLEQYQDEWEYNNASHFLLWCKKKL